MDFSEHDHNQYYGKERLWKDKSAADSLIMIFFLIHKGIRVSSLVKSRHSVKTSGSAVLPRARDRSQRREHALTRASRTHRRRGTTDATCARLPVLSLPVRRADSRRGSELLCIACWLLRGCHARARSQPEQGSASANERRAISPRRGTACGA